MLSVILLAILTASPDDAPKPKLRPAAMMLDLKGKVEIRPVEGKTKAAEIGDLLYPSERLAVPAGGSATVSILGAGARETIKPGTEAQVGPKGCTPPEVVASRKEQPKPVAATMKNLRPAPGDGRKAGVGFRSGPDQPPAITPIFAATVFADRPKLSWPTAPHATSYRVRLVSGGGREQWRAESKEPHLAYPADKPALQPGLVYRWEVTDQDFRKVAEGEFTAATASERSQLADLQVLSTAPDRADRLAAALSYHRLDAYAEAIAAYEALARESPAEPAYRRSLADLYRLAGRSEDARAMMVEVSKGRE